MGKFEKPRTNKPSQPKPTAAQKKAGSGKAAAPKKSKKPGQGKKIALIVAAVVLVLVIGFVGYALTIHNSGSIFKGVHVAGVDVGGMSKEEAVAAVEEAVSATYSTTTLTVKLPDRTLSFEPADTKVSLNVEKAVDEAWEYGRDGGIFATLKATFSGVSGDHFINIEDSLTLDEEYIRSSIDAVAAEVKSDKVDSTYEVVEGEVTSENEDGETVTETVPTELVIHVGSSKRSLDADGLYDAVIAAYMNNDFSAIEYDYEEEGYTPVDLSALYDQMCTDMADAYYDAEKKEIVDEVVGYGFDLSAAEQQQAMAEEGSDLTITLSAVEPEVTRAELEEKLFHDVLGAFNSEHTWNAARTTNLELSCKAIDGTILNPGDVFSFNEIVGERTAEKGYQAATVFVSGDSKPELGGGVCQVASTIYYCALMADLNIVERLEHMFTVTYVPPGMDATIYWGSNVDFKFENSTEYPLRIDASVYDGYVHIALVGTKTTDTRVELDYRLQSTTNWQDVTKVDETKPADYKEVIQTPYTGYVYQTVKRYVDADGNPISDWEPVQFPKSVYQKRDRITVIGKQEEEPTTDPDDPNGTGVIDPGTDTGTTTPPTDTGTTTPPTDTGTTTPPTDTGTTTPSTDTGTTTPPEDTGTTTDTGNNAGVLD